MSDRVNYIILSMESTHTITHSLAYFGLSVSAAVLLRVVRRDFTPLTRVYAEGLPFAHSLMSHRGGARENVENTLPGE